MVGKKTPSEQKATSPNVASKASKALQDGRTPKTTKSLAGSALSQAKGRRGSARGR